MKRSCRRIAALGWIGLCLLTVSCAGTKPEPRSGPDGARLAELRQQGDSEFAKMHWRGWKNAAGLYEQALAARDDAGLRQRLFTAYILLSLRETELLIRNASWLQKAESLLPGIPASPHASYFALANEKSRFISLNRSGFTAYGSSELKGEPPARDSASALSYYLYLAYLGLVIGRDESEKFIAEENEFRRLHGNSNLALFLRSWTPREMDEKLAAFPDFAEMYKLRGDWHNQGEKYQAALADYQRAVEIMPVMHKASNAMGTICYALEEYGEALGHYEHSLAIDPLEPSALFGRAICLSELRRYEESDQALRLMVEKQTFYHGEANYYLAKNSYYRQRWAETRSYLDLASAYIPDSPEMNMLSGLLYLDQNQPGRAALDFRKVLEQEPQHAEAWYFLGQAALQEKKMRDARRHFQAAIANFRSELEKFDAKLARLKSEGESDRYQQNFYVKRLRQRSAYSRQVSGRLALLQETFRKPPLPGLRELLADLAAPPPGQ